MPMTPRHGSPYTFDPGALCLELLLAGGPGAYTAFESLHEPEDLARWSSLSRLDLDPGGVRVDEAGLTAARLLRDALWRIVLAHLAGRALPPEDVAEVNRAAARAPLTPAMDATRRCDWILPADATAVLSTVARDAIGLFTGPLAERVRECGSPDCRLVFVDTSRPGRRRWCSMERCGNRAKVRSLRARREAEEQGAC